MFEIPLGKALVPVETDATTCSEGGCVFWIGVKGCKVDIACDPANREDGKYVVFKLVDYPVKEDNEC